MTSDVAHLFMSVGHLCVLRGEMSFQVLIAVLNEIIFLVLICTSSNSLTNYNRFLVES